MRENTGVLLFALRFPLAAAACDLRCELLTEIRKIQMRRSKFIFASAILMPPTFRLAVFVAFGRRSEFHKFLSLLFSPPMYAGQNL
jgi:hypothetical protein